jgi:MoxR-like ATPase
MTEQVQQSVSEFQSTFRAIKSEVAKLIVGNDSILDLTLSGLFAGGHVLLEGVPGLGKTRLVRSVAESLGLTFKRIQFTPDLMPSDVTGTQVLTEEDGQRKFIFRQGPVFTNVLLADEINRATPKTQSALLEALEERQVSVLGETHKLPDPFFVLATQNPIELEGTYPLPEAQLDRFMFKLQFELPTSQELKTILQRTTALESPKVECVLGENRLEKIAEMRSLVRSVMIADPLQDVLVRLMFALNPESQYCPDEIKSYVRFGPGPRGGQALVLGAKVQALLDGRMHVSYEDLKKVFVPTLRHRLLLNFQAQAEEITSDDLLIMVRDAK